MNKGVKIFIGVVASLGILSGIFLLYVKMKAPAAPIEQVKKPAPVVKNSTVTPGTGGDSVSQPAAPKKALPSKITTTQPSAQDRKALVRSQWTDCKAGTLAASTHLFWRVQITEGIPLKGTYAKGNLDNDTAFPVQVTIKSDSQIAEKIKVMLVVGKTALLRGACTGVAADGSVMIQAF